MKNNIFIYNIIIKMKLNEFKELSGVEMCELMNQCMENHTTRNFNDIELKERANYAPKSGTHAFLLPFK